MSDAPNAPSVPSQTDDRNVTPVSQGGQFTSVTPPSGPSEPQVPARAKEQAVPSEKITFLEASPGIGTLESEPIPPEVEAWMEKVGSETSEVKLDSLPPVQVSPPTPKSTSSSQTTFVLPLGEEEMKLGMKADVNDSIHWLATWCQRIILQLRGQVAYRQTKS